MLFRSLYELFICNPCGLDPKTKVSLDWIVQRQDADGEWVEVNGNLSDYVELGIYTMYNQLNQYGQCQSIAWLGGPAPDQLGYCTPAPSGYTLLDSIHGLNNGCNTPTNYPGAMQATQGNPYSFATQLGLVLPAMGMVHIYSQALDFFYLDFFSQTRNILQLKWLQAGN